MPEGGGAEGSRTPDLLIANETLYQLSYDPVPTARRRNGRPPRGRQARDSFLPQSHTHATPPPIRPTQSRPTSRTRDRITTPLCVRKLTAHLHSFERSTHCTKGVSTRFYPVSFAHRIDRIQPAE